MHSNDTIAFWVPIAEPPPADHLQLLYPRTISMSHQTYQQERRKQQFLINADNVVMAATRVGGLRAALQSLHPHNPAIISMALHQDTKVLDASWSKYYHDGQSSNCWPTNLQQTQLTPDLLQDRRNSQQEATDGAACEESSLAGGTQNSFLHMRFRSFSALTIITCRNKNNNKILDSFIRFISLQFDPIMNHFVGTKTAIFRLDRFRFLSCFGPIITL